MATLSSIITPTNIVTATSTTTLTNKTLTAPTIASANLTTALTLAGAAGTNGQVLTSAGSGLPSWTTVSAGFTLGTPVATTSGTSIDFTGIPAGTKMIVISFVGVSTNGTTTPLFQLGDAGGIENTGYLSTSFKIRDSATPLANTTTDGFNIYSDLAAAVINGSLILTLENSTTFSWVVQGSFSNQAGTLYALITSGRKLLSQQLDRVRITTVSGTDTFDAGEINIAYL